VGRLGSGVHEAWTPVRLGAGPPVLAWWVARIRVMSTLVLGPRPAELEALIELRRKAGADRHDEVWNGVLHMAPAPTHGHGRLQWQLAVVLGPLATAAGLEATGEINIGAGAHDYRVPDGALHRPGAGGLWHPTAALVIEILSPDDETRDKLPFYAAHAVDELLIVDPAERQIEWLALRDGEYHGIPRSRLIELGAAELADRLEWP
jgi:Uma2 family endonuclease